MTIPPHTVRPCQLICCFLQSQHVHQVLCIPLVHQLHTAHRPHHISFWASQNSYFIFSQTPRFASNIADLTWLLCIFPFIRKENLFPKSISLHSEFLPSHSCSCSYSSFTSSTGIQPIAKIAKSLHNFYFITHYLLLLFSCSICRFLTFATNKKSCRTWSYFLVVFIICCNCNYYGKFIENLIPSISFVAI